MLELSIKVWLFYNNAIRLEVDFGILTKAKLKSDLYRVCLDMTILSKTMSSIPCKVNFF